MSSRTRSCWQKGDRGSGRRESTGHVVPGVCEVPVVLLSPDDWLEVLRTPWSRGGCVVPAIFEGSMQNNPISRPPPLAAACKAAAMQ